METEIQTEFPHLPQGSFRFIKSTVLPLTMELAIAHHDLPASPTERDFKPLRVKQLREKAEAGHLVAFQWAKAKLDGRWVRMNGQHSSTMLTQLNGEFPKDLSVTVDEYEVDNLHGLALLFRQFDDRKGSRSPSDVAGAYQGLYDDLREVPKDTAKRGIDGIAWYLQDIQGDYRVPTQDDKYRMFDVPVYHPFLLWLGDLFSIKTPELKQTNVVGAIYATFKIGNNDDVRQFWDQVARGGVEYEDSAPSTVLDRGLKDAKEGKLKEKLKPLNYFNGCIYAWNAYREGRQIKDIKWDTRKGILVPHA